MDDGDSVRTITSAVLAHMRAGEIRVGWTDSGTMAWREDGEEWPSTVTEVAPDSDEIPVFAGAFVMWSITNTTRAGAAPVVAGEGDGGVRMNRAARRRAQRSRLRPL